MARKNWWPTAIADQLVLVNNFATKIASYNLALPLTAPQVALAQGLCEAFVGAVNMTELARTTMQAMTQWRDLVLEGEPVGDPVPASPTFPAGGAVDYTRGTVPQFFKFRELILAAPGYTETIGQDLGLIGAEITPEPEGDVAPDLKIAVVSGYKISVGGSLQGRDALRIEYQRNGGSWTQVGFITKTPGEVTVTPQTPGQPESGNVRGVFIDENEPFGNFSPSYPVTVS